MQLAKQASLWICEQNLILHILNKFYDDDVIHKKIMTILSTSFSGILNIFYETYKKETAGILKCIDQLPQNLARVRNLVGSFDQRYKNVKFFYSSYCFHCFLLFVYYPPFVPTLTLY